MPKYATMPEMPPPDKARATAGDYLRVLLAGPLSVRELATRLKRRQEAVMCYVRHNRPEWFECVGGWGHDSVFALTAAGRKALAKLPDRVVWMPGARHKSSDLFQVFIRSEQRKAIRAAIRELKTRNVDLISDHVNLDPVCVTWRLAEIGEGRG